MVLLQNEDNPLRNHLNNYKRQAIIKAEKQLNGKTNEWYIRPSLTKYNKENANTSDAPHWTQ